MSGKESNESESTNVRTMLNTKTGIAYISIPDLIDHLISGLVNTSEAETRRHINFLASSLNDLAKLTIKKGR